jgi:flavin-dependent dehydrogenase
MALARIGVHVDVPSAPFGGISLRMPQGSLLAREPHIGRVVRRIEYDAALAEQVRRRGVALREGVKVTGLERDADGVTITTDQGDLRAKVVLGADGVGSVVRKSLGLGAGSWRAQVLEVDTEETALDHPRDIVHFDAGDHSFDGYEWDFPTVVGGQKLQCRGVYHLMVPGARASDVDITARLAARLERFGLDLARCKKKRYSERGFDPHEPYAAPRTLLIGEAAGIDPITGEGIAQAILYGQLAAGYVLSRLDANDLSFSDWPAHLGRTTLGLDLKVRYELCRRFFGPSREFYERSLVATPDGFHAGIRYFGGLPISLGQAGGVLGAWAARLWRERDAAPWRGIPATS